MFLGHFDFASGTKVRKSCRSKKMLQNLYLIAKIGFDTAESEPSKIKCLHSLIPQVWSDAFMENIRVLIERPEQASLVRPDGCDLRLQDGNHPFGALCQGRAVPRSIYKYCFHSLEPFSWNLSVVRSSRSHGDIRWTLLRLPHARGRCRLNMFIVHETANYWK